MQGEIHKLHNGAQLFILAMLYIVTSLLSGNGSFMLFGAIYLVLMLSISKLVNRRDRVYFLTLTINFLLIYSGFIICSHFILIHDPLQDYYVGIDETKFIQAAIDLGNLPISRIWSVAFHDFGYSESPLFYAYIGTLQHWTGLVPFYSLLFLKLNVAFIGSLIPAVVYLLCSHLVDSIKAYKAAWIYGLVSFVFFYSVGLLRDIHVALIYAVALYIITVNNYSIRNYVALMLLAVLAYYIRVENGIFFLAFLGVWILNAKTKYKIPVYIFSVGILIIGIYFLGGVDLIIHTTTKTTKGYTEQSIDAANLGSIGVMLNRLPVPLNYISKAAFGQILPFPFWIDSTGTGDPLMRIFYIPYALAGLFWFWVWTRLIVQLKRNTQFFKRYKWIMLLALIYIIMVSAGQAGPRRLMAVYPVIFMGYIAIDKKSIKNKEVGIAIYTYILLLMIYILLKVVL